MSFVVFSGSYPLVCHHPTFIQWKKDSRDTVECHSVDDVPEKSSGIFFDPPAIIVIVESIKASDLRQLLYRAEETGEDMCIISSKKPQGKFDKDGISIIDVPYPSSIKKRAEVIRGMFFLDKKSAIQIAQKCNDPLQACIVARQYSLCPNSTQWSLFFIPEEKDTPPWLITDAINEGNSAVAVKEARILLRKKKITPQSLAMQITGYYTKVLSSEKKFFLSLRKRHVLSSTGIIEDMSYYPEAILSSNKSSSLQSMLAYVASLSSRMHK